MRKIINITEYEKKDLAEQIRFELEHELIDIGNAKADVIIDIVKRIGFEEDVNLVKSSIRNCRPTLEDVIDHLKDLVIMEVDDEKDDQLTLAEHFIANSWEDKSNIALTMDNVVSKSDNLHPSTVVLKWYMKDHKRYLEKKERTQEGYIKKREKKSFYLLVDKIYFDNNKDIEPKQQLYFLYHHDESDK